MTAFAEYLLKVMICSGILTGYYWLALRNKLFHSWNRFYLLAAVGISLLLPFIKISFVTDPQPENIPAYTLLQTVTTNEVWFPEQTVTPSATPITTEQISLLLYVLVSFGLFVTLVVMLLRIKKLIAAYVHWKMKDLTFVDTDAKGTPFSFLHYIFWNREIDFESAQGQQIFKHELIHVKEKHSIDKLFLQLVLIVFWINPFFWIIRKELTMIHEFIADSKSVKDSDASALAAMILTAAFPGHTLSLTNPFFYSPIKRRLLMLSKLQHPKAGYISRLLLLPLLTFLFTAFALKMKEKDAAAVIPKLEKPLTVVIDAGHGLIDGKRHGSIGLNGITEDEIALAISNKIRQLNTDPNLKLIFTRSDENFIEQKERVRIAEANNADLFVSIHSNYVPQLRKDGTLSENPMNGFELYVTRDGNQYLQESKELGSAIISEMKNFMPIREPGIKQRNSGIWVIDAAPCPAVLLECGFVSNSKDLSLLTNEKSQKKIAEAVLKGIVNYVSQKKIVNNNSPSINPTISDTIPDKKNIVFTKTEVDAKFKGNWTIFVREYLSKYSEILENDPKSKNNSCLVEFIVNEEGSISKIRVLSNTESELAKLSVELMKNSPFWEPAKQNGKAVTKLVKTSIQYFDKDAWARYEKSKKEAGDSNTGMAKLTDKYGLFILDGKEVSKEEMHSFLANNKSMNNWKFDLNDGTSGRNRYGDKGKNGVMEVTTKVLVPTVAIAAENINILYADIENPLKIAISDVPDTYLEIDVSQGKLEKKDNRYILKNLKKGDVVIKIGYYYKTDEKKTEEVRFKVISMPDPAVTIAESSGGRIEAAKITQSKQLSIDEDWEITNYTVYFTGNGFETNPGLVAGIKGNNFTKEVIDLLAKSKPGTTIIVDEILAKSKKSELKKRLPPLAFNLY